MSVTAETTRERTAVRTEMALRCVVAAWDCQIHSFFGSPETVAGKLADLPKDLVERRVYVLAVQGEGRAEVRVFERGSLDDPEGTVATWQGESLGDLVATVTDTLIANHGVHCPGEQVSSVLYGGREFAVQGPVPVPVSARAAFGHPLKGFREDAFIQASVIVLC